MSSTNLAAAPTVIPATDESKVAALLAITAEQIDAAIAAAEKRAKARTCAGEGKAIVERLAQAVEIARAAGLPAHLVALRSDGGAVSRNYNKGMGGDSTVVHVSASGVNAYRDRARTVAHGDNGIRYVYILHNGDTCPIRAKAKEAGLTLRTGKIILVEG